MAETLAQSREKVGASRRLSARYVLDKALAAYLRLFVHPPAELYNVPGYLHRLEGRFLYWLAGRAPRGGTVLEVGSFKGRSSGFLAAGLPESARLICVDTWRNDAMPYDEQADVMPEFMANVSRYRDRLEICRGRSSQVVAGWRRPIDVLFIDGDHSYEGCSEDLKAWAPFVRSGGWIVLHDSGEAGVARAIAELFPPAQRGASLYAWSILAARKRSAGR